MRTVGAVIIGQSNEQGPAYHQGSAQPVRWSSAFGWPNADAQAQAGWETGRTVYASHWYGTMWSLLAEHLWVRRRVRLLVSNAARGGSGQTDHWTGRIVVWAAENGFGRKLGEAVLPTVANGRRYRCTTGGVGGASEPSWPTTPGATVADGGLTWTCELADAGDVHGRVYAPGQSGYDPNGYIAAAKERLARMPAGCERWVLVSGNQSDLDRRTIVTAQQRAQALISMVEDLLAAGAQGVALGVTCYFNSLFEGSGRSYEAILLPSVRLALAHFRADPRVIEGADLFTALGKGVALRAEATPIHMTPESTWMAARAWRDALEASGRF